jgi:hypothetical protein
MDERERRAQEAEFILASDVFRGAFETLDARYVAQWRTAGGAAERELAWVQQKVLNEIRSELAGLVTQWKLTTRRHSNG